MPGRYWREVCGSGVTAFLLALAASLALAAPAVARGSSPDRRAAELVSQMTLDEKIQLVHGIGVCSFTPGNYPGSERSLKGAGFIPGIPRLGIPDVNYTDAGSGVTNCGARPNGQSTMLPSPLARASSWDPSVASAAGDLIGREARVQGFTGLLGGVSELIREPRWGRSFETLGEDPLLNGTLVANEVRAVQRNKVVGTIKHYAANNQETRPPGAQRRDRRAHVARAAPAALRDRRPRLRRPERDVLVQPHQRHVCLRERLSPESRAEGRHRLQGPDPVRLGRHAQHGPGCPRRPRRGGVPQPVLLTAAQGRGACGRGAGVAPGRHGAAQAARADRGRHLRRPAGGPRLDRRRRRGAGD